jgi:glycosyltransferase involved in cell wall biosynthesis
MGRKMSEKIKISVVMPSMNEQGAIGPMIEEIKKYSGDFETEILLIDSSKDQTPEIARALGARVIQQKPQGHGVALRSGIRQAEGDIIITTDCDNTYPMDFIPRLVQLMTLESLDLISCSRLNSGLGKEMPLMNKIANWAFAFMVRLLYAIPTHDVSTGMFCMRRNVAQKINWETNYSFPCEIIIRSNQEGFKFKEIDIPYKVRIGEVTLNRWRSGKAYLRCIFNYRFKLSVDPKLL